MRFRIHYEIEKDGETYEDSVLLAGETIEEIRDKADFEMLKRGGKNPWSEEV